MPCPGGHGCLVLNRSERTLLGAIPHPTSLLPRSTTTHCAVPAGLTATTTAFWKLSLKPAAASSRAVAQFWLTVETRCPLIR